MGREHVLRSNPQQVQTAVRSNPELCIYELRSWSYSWKYLVSSLLIRVDTSSAFNSPFFHRYSRSLLSRWFLRSQKSPQILQIGVETPFIVVECAVVDVDHRVESINQLRLLPSRITCKNNLLLWRTLPNRIEFRSECIHLFVHHENSLHQLIHLFKYLADSILLEVKWSQNTPTLYLGIHSLRFSSFMSSVALFDNEYAIICHSESVLRLSFSILFRSISIPIVFSVKDMTSSTFQDSVLFLALVSFSPFPPCILKRREWNLPHVFSRPFPFNTKWLPIRLLAISLRLVCFQMTELPM